MPSTKYRQYRYNYQIEFAQTPHIWWMAPFLPSLRIDALPAGGIIAEPLEDYSPNVLASALSHKSLWERAVSTAAPVTIAEDDAVLNRCFSQRGGEGPGQAARRLGHHSLGLELRLHPALRSHPGPERGRHEFRSVSLAGGAGSLPGDRHRPHAAAFVRRILASSATRCRRRGRTYCSGFVSPCATR